MLYFIDAIGLSPLLAKPADQKLLLSSLHRST